MHEYMKRGQQLNMINNNEKMKKIKVILIILISIILLDVNSSVYASDDNVKVEYLSDGDYIEVITLKEEADNINLLGAEKTVSGKKTLNYLSKSGKSLWSVTVHGVYTYTKQTSKCISSKVSTTVKNEHWKISNTNAYKIENSANASAVAKRINNGKIVETISKNISLKCNTNGKLY